MAISNATNFSNAKEMFEGRSAYKEEYPKSDIQFDTGYTNRLFGKVDTLGNIVQINEGFLSFFGTKDDKGNVSCVNFMADAFIDCRKQYNIEVSKGKINTASPYFSDKLSVYQGWQKQETFYSQSNNGIYVALLDYIQKNSFKVANFDYYTQILLKFLKEKDLPLTRIGFFESGFNPAYTSGLVLDLYDGDAGDDALREQFISDPNYSLVSDLFADRGLRFDTQVPWRLVANIQSDNLRPYIQKRLKPNFVLQDVFDKFYFKSLEGVKFTAFQELKTIVKAFYNAYKGIFPKYNQFTYNANSCNSVKNIFVYAQDIKMKTDSKEEDLFFLDLYYQIRLIETHSLLKDEVQEFHRQNYRGLYLYNQKRITGIEKALNYINYNLGTLAYRSPSVDEINLTRTGNAASM